MISAQHYKFPHELAQTPETKIPEYKVKYSKKKKNALASVATQTPGPEVGTQTDGQILGEMPARVYSINTYSPLVPSPSTTPTSQISTVPTEIQQILASYPPVLSSPDTFSPMSIDSPTISLSEMSPKQLETWEKLNSVINRPDRPLPIVIDNPNTELTPRPRPPPGFYTEPSTPSSGSVDSVNTWTSSEWDRRYNRPFGGFLSIGEKVSETPVRKTPHRKSKK